LQKNQVALITSQMRAVRVRVQLHSSLTWPLDGAERSTLSPNQFSPTKGPHGTHSTGGWVGPREGASVLEKQENLLTVPCWGKVPYVVNRCYETISIHAPCPTQPPVQWVPGLSRG